MICVKSNIMSACGDYVIAAQRRYDICIKPKIISACGDCIIITLDFVKIKGNYYNLINYIGTDIK